MLDYRDPTSWRWRLTGAGGGFLADHAVELDPDEWRFAAFADPHRYLARHAAPHRRREHEAELLAEVGDWVAERVLGPVARELARRREPVRLELPARAAELAHRPWELARVDGRALPEHRVGFVVELLPRTPVDKAGVGERLRVLALFSVPEDAGALNLRKERHALAGLVHDIAAVGRRGVELRVLQYGATRQRLEDALLEEAGWDVVHLSGHGLPAGLVLEDEAGGRDLVGGAELVDLLDLAAGRIKLVTLSACESAAVAAAGHLHVLGLAPPAEAADAAGSLPAVAAEVVRRLDCAVLAMRYPVADDFAIALAGRFYELLLGKGQPVAKALALALPQAVGRPGAPPLSVATPTLFGARAGELRLVPPPGGPLVFQAERQKLAGFPAQPDRFVGRVGPLARATAALAPRSGRSGVLFHGMAGAGKTSCALELAYAHQESFPLMAWYAAPPEGEAVTTSLTDFALALENQLPGLKLVHSLSDAGSLRRLLAGLTEALEHNRVLIVVDNAESLLTTGGEWRDERWGWFVDAMTGHRGLSRLVLTSRRPPARLADGVLVEAVHSLSLQETVLLAREWPNLRALVDDPASRDLARRVLTLVQGHPKLVELADGHAADPERLADLLDQADGAWRARGVQVEPFLRGDSTASDEDYLAVLDRWTRTAVASVPPESADFFRFLCCLEDGDRVDPVAGPTWPQVRRRLGRSGEAPGVDPVVAPLVRQALVRAVAVEEVSARLYLVHPAIADTGRAMAGQAFRDAADAELGDYWMSALSSTTFEQRKGTSGLLALRAARSAPPYLLRQRRWAELLTAVDQAAAHDQSPANHAALLSLLAVAVDATRGAAEEEHALRAFARLLARAHPEQAEGLLRRLLDSATAREKHHDAIELLHSLVEVCLRGSRYDEALALLDAKVHRSTLVDLGPWSRLHDERTRLEILSRLGRHQQVMEAVRRHRATMASLPDRPGDNDAHVWVDTVREGILNLGAVTASELGRWQEALDLNAEVRSSMARRNASTLLRAECAFNDHGPLLALGRVEEALTLLQWCREVFQGAGSVAGSAQALGALGNAEVRLGHPDRALRLVSESLRLHYAIPSPAEVARSHRNVALCLDLLHAEPEVTWAHLAAAAVVEFQIGVPSDHLAVIGSLLREQPTVPRAFDQVCAIVGGLDGVRLADLVERLPRRAPDGQVALDEVLRLAQAPPPPTN